MPRRKENLTGKTFGHLKVLKFHRYSSYSHKYWVCQCICGKQIYARQDHLKRGERLSCGCKTERHPNRKKRERNPERRKAIRTFNNYKSRSKKLKISFSLTKEQFVSVIEQPCFYCGESELVHTIDRVDSKRGYVEDNVVPACLMCNVAKNKYSQDVFLAWVRKIYEFNF